MSAQLPAAAASGSAERVKLLLGCVRLGFRIFFSLNSMGLTPVRCGACCMLHGPHAAALGLTPVRAAHAACSMGLTPLPLRWAQTCGTWRALLWRLA